MKISLNLSSLLLLIRQTCGQTEYCSEEENSDDETKDISCPSGVQFEINNEHQSLDVTCQTNVSAEQLKKDLTSISTSMKKKLNVKQLTLRGCPAPGGSDSLSTWLLGSSGRTEDLKNKHFAGFIFLKKIELYDSIETLGPQLLSNLVSLEEFECSTLGYGTQLISVDKLAFKGNKALRKIRIRDSNVSEIHQNTFKELSNLESLDLRSNKLTKVAKDTFKGLGKLRSLDLGYNRITSIPKGLLADLRALKVLALRHNSISHLPQDLLINNVNLKSFSAQNQEGGFLEIPDGLFKRSTSLESLHLQGNSLNLLPGGLLKGLRKLKKLNLHENNLTNSALTKEMLKDLVALKEINLSRNQFTSPITEHLLAAKATLKKVDLAHNHLSTFESGWATNFINLKKINLTDNRLKGAVYERDFRFQTDGDVKVDLGHNQIDRLAPDQRSGECLKPKVELDLRHNSVGCDCDRKEKEGSCILVQGLACPDSLTCQIKCEDLMSNKLFQICQCSYFPDDRSAVVDCSSSARVSRGVPLPLQKTENIVEKIEEIKVILRAQNLTKLNSSMWEVANNIRAKINLDVSNNKIEKILPENLPQNLSELSLENNLITGFDLRTLKHLNQSFKDNSISLGQNPYSCDCSKSKLFLDFVKNGLKAKIKDANNVNFTCSPSLPLKRGSDIIIAELCRETSMTASVYVLSLLFLIPAACLLAIVLMKKKNLQLRFFSLPWVSDRIPEDWNLAYDVFISYSVHDKDFAEDTLWHQLESESYSCCVHTRDFVVGDAISDQILRAVHQSRRTIIVLSPQYAESAWTKLEFQAAHAK